MSPWFGWKTIGGKNHLEAEGARSRRQKWNLIKSVQLDVCMRRMFSILCWSNTTMLVRIAIGFRIWNLDSEIQTEIQCKKYWVNLNALYAPSGAQQGLSGPVWSAVRRLWVLRTIDRVSRYQSLVAHSLNLLKGHWKLAKRVTVAFHPEAAESGGPTVPDNQRAKIFVLFIK